MGGPLAAVTDTPSTTLPIVDHPTWTCPGAGDLHPPELACCPCDHGLGGCCLHEPGADPEHTHRHECVGDGGAGPANG